MHNQSHRQTHTLTNAHTSTLSLRKSAATTTVKTLAAAVLLCLIAYETFCRFETCKTDALRLLNN